MAKQCEDVKKKTDKLAEISFNTIKKKDQYTNI